MKKTSAERLNNVPPRKRWTQLHSPLRAVIQDAVFSPQIFEGPAVRKVFTKPEKVGESGEVTVWQSAGEQLDQGDADVYFELVRGSLKNLRPDSPLVELRVNVAAFLKAIGRDSNPTERERLKCTLARLQRNSYIFEAPGMNAWDTRFVFGYTCYFDNGVASILVTPMNPELLRAFESSPDYRGFGVPPSH